MFSIGDEVVATKGTDLGKMVVTGVSGGGGSRDKGSV